MTIFRPVFISIRLLFLVVTAVAVMASAQIVPSTQPLTRQTAKLNYDLARRKVETDYLSFLASANQQYIDDLNAALKAAMERGPDGLDEAKAIEVQRQQAMKDAQSPQTLPVVTVVAVPATSSVPVENKLPNDTAAFRKFLDGSTWGWGTGTIKLLPTGYVFNDVWEASKLTTRWEALDRRTVLLIVEKGRITNRYAVLVFSEDLQEYNGYGFDNADKLPRNQRQK